MSFRINDTEEKFLEATFYFFELRDQDKFGLLQPIPEALLDKEFQLDGWRLEDAKTGVLRKKETHHQNANLEQVVEVEKFDELGPYKIQEIGQPYHFNLIILSIGLFLVIYNIYYTWDYSLINLALF